eukprot:gene9261-12476_t
MLGFVDSNTSTVENSEENVRPLIRSHSLPTPTQPSLNRSNSLRGSGYVPANKLKSMATLSQNGVVQVFCDQLLSDWSTPWQFLNMGSSTGSGFIIGKRLIVTNMHVVKRAKTIQLKRQSDSEKYEARLVANAERVDLALLTVDNELFWENSQSLEINEELIGLQAEIDVVGYPVGGRTVSITNGVVSRIDWSVYTQSGYANLIITVDAAINPGNSGGPCICDGKVVGVAFQSLYTADGIGYIIPSTILSTVVKEYLKALYSVKKDPSLLSYVDDIKRISIEDAKSSTQLTEVIIPTFGHFDAKYMTLDNPSLRKYVNLPGNTIGGILVTDIPNLSWLTGVLEKDDVITTIDDVAIGFDGTIGIDNGGRIDFRLLLSLKVIGMKISLKIFRKGEFITAQTVVGHHYELLPRRWIRETEQYLIFAGLVFVPLSVELLESSNVRRGLGTNYTALENMELKYPWQYIVVVSMVLPHRINMNMGDSWLFLKPLLNVNGVPIHHLNDVAQVLDECEKKANGWSALKDDGAVANDNNLNKEVDGEKNSSDITTTKINDLVWARFEFGDKVIAAFDTLEAIEATKSIAESLSIKNTRQFVIPQKNEN